jgi:transposase
MLAELVDAVVGVDTHRDTHEAEIAHPTGMPIATCQVSNDSTGYAELLAWIVDHAPGPRLVVSIEGTRSYGLPLARAVTSAGRSWSSASNRTARLAAARGSPTRSTRTWPC